MIPATTTFEDLFKGILKDIFPKHILTIFVVATIPILLEKLRANEGNKDNIIIDQSASVILLSALNGVAWSSIFLDLTEIRIRFVKSGLFAGIFGDKIADTALARIVGQSIWQAQFAIIQTLIGTFAQSTNFTDKDNPAKLKNAPIVFIRNTLAGIVSAILLQTATVFSAETFKDNPVVDYIFCTLISGIAEIIKDLFAVLIPNLNSSIEESFKDSFKKKGCSLSYLFNVKAEEAKIACKFVNSFCYGIFKTLSAKLLKDNPVFYTLSFVGLCIATDSLEYFYNQELRLIDTEDDKNNVSAIYKMHRFIVTTVSGSEVDPIYVAVK